MVGEGICAAGIQRFVVDLYLVLVPVKVLIQVLVLIPVAIPEGSYRIKV